MSSKPKHQVDIITEVEELVRRMNELEYIVDLEKDAPWASFDGAKILWGTDRRRLSECLALAKKDYELNRNNRTLRLSYAEGFLHYFNHALTRSMIVEGKGLIHKLEECSDEKESITNELENVKDELQRVSTAYVELQGAYKELEKRLPTKKEDVYRE